MALELEDLTDEQYEFFIRHIWNGVGSQEFALKPPALIFNPASVRHDFYYWRGGGEIERLAADVRFLNEALQACDYMPWTTRWFYVGAAHVYYRGLRVLGQRSFEYSERPAETWEEFFARWQEHQGGVLRAFVTKIRVAYAENILGGLWQQQLA